MYEVKSFAIMDMMWLFLGFLIPYIILRCVYEKRLVKIDEESFDILKWGCRLYPYVYVVFLLVFFLAR